MFGHVREEDVGYIGNRMLRTEISSTRKKNDGIGVTEKDAECRRE